MNHSPHYQNTGINFGKPISHYCIAIYSISFGMNKCMRRTFTKLVNDYSATFNTLSLPAKASQIYRFWYINSISLKLKAKESCG